MKVMKGSDQNLGFTKNKTFDYYQKNNNLGLTGTVLMNLIAVDWAWYSDIKIQP